MNTIWKYILPFDLSRNLLMPEGAQVLTAQLQDGRITLWARVSPPGPMTTRRFLIVETGHPVDLTDTHYIATVQDAECVWHVFEDYSKPLEREQV